MNLSGNVTDNHAVNRAFNVTNMTGVVVSTLIGTTAERRDIRRINTSGTTYPAITVQDLANDTSNNLNNTINTTFTVSDTTVPRVISPSSNIGRGNQSNSFNITVTVYDYILLDTVTINVSNSSGIVVSSLAATASDENVSSAVFTTTSTTSPGNYTYKIIANDSSGNINMTITSTFVVNDVTKPLVLGASSTPVIGNQSNNFNLTVNVTDNFLVDKVYFNVTNPNGIVIIVLNGVSTEAPITA